MTLRQAAQQALEALISYERHTGFAFNATDNLRTALQKQQQGPCKTCSGTGQVETGIGMLVCCECHGITYDTQPEAAPEQEPVACVIDGDLYFQHEIDWEDLAYQGHGVELLYTTPPQRKPLTMDEIGKAWSVADGEHNASASVKRRITGAIEAAHNIKD